VRPALPSPATPRRRYANPAPAAAVPRPPPQINQAWQSLSLEASPYKADKTVAYVVEKAAAFASLSSGSSLDGAASVDGGDE
jgi:hypothetical protein